MIDSLRFAYQNIVNKVIIWKCTPLWSYIHLLPWWVLFYKYLTFLVTYYKPRHAKADVYFYHFWGTLILACVVTFSLSYKFCIFPVQGSVGLWHVTELANLVILQILVLKSLERLFVPWEYPCQLFRHSFPLFYVVLCWSSASKSGTRSIFLSILTKFVICTWFEYWCILFVFLSFSLLWLVRICVCLEVWFYFS